MIRRNASDEALGFKVAL